MPSLVSPTGSIAWTWLTNTWLPRLRQNILIVLQLCTHPLWLAQGLLTNLPNRDWENAQELSRLLGVPPNPARAGGFGTLVPESLKPWQFVAKVESGGGEGEA
jgi:hypothetical protein